MKTKLMLFYLFLACSFIFLPSCGKSNSASSTVSNAQNTAKTTDSIQITSTDTAAVNHTTAIFSDSGAIKKDNSMTQAEKKTVLPAVSGSAKTNPSKQAVTKVSEKNENMHTTTDTKPIPAYNTVTTTSTKTQNNTSGTTKNEKQNTTQVIDNTQTNMPPAAEEKKPMYPKDPLPPKPREVLDIFFTAADNFLKRNVAAGSGLVNYAAIKADKTELNALVQKIAAASLSETTDAEKQAFYINAYNILVIKQVIDNYLPKSPLDVPGFFNQTKYQVARKTTTLDQLEKNTLFGLKKDPRFHFVLVCGAIGCPPLLNAAYLPASLNKQLTRQTQNALNNNNFIKTDSRAASISVSKIFEWYKDDFTTNGKTIHHFINQYRNTAIPDNYAVTYYEYNWNLNQQ